ncbi:YggS family pyridoxal phosphate-dependent enzyme [bacterium]|nr:YggS family pyridoxal phosphate-dependent enzyme [bacterium]
MEKHQTNQIINAQQRLHLVKSRIATALIQSQKRTEDVSLVAVSKGHSIQAIREMYALGIRDFAENYAQELFRKHEELADLADIRWHFIGHLQSNKAKSIAEISPLIHSVDRPSLLAELKKHASPQFPLHILIQLQVDPLDAKKSGCPFSEADELCRQVAQCPGILWDGFMGMGPVTEDIDKLSLLYQRFVQRSVELWDKHAPRDPSRQSRHLKISLGMSDDLEIALRAGSTLLRIGSALFGPRPGRSQAT